jgi:hypothetical protein
MADLSVANKENILEVQEVRIFIRSCPVISMKKSIIHIMHTPVASKSFETVNNSKYLQRTQRNQNRKFRCKVRDSVLQIRHGLSSFSSLTYRDEGKLQQIYRHGQALEIYQLQQSCPSFHTIKPHNLNSAVQ